MDSKFKVGLVVPEPVKPVVPEVKIMGRKTIAKLEAVIAELQAKTSVGVDAAAAKALEDEKLKTRTLDQEVLRLNNVLTSQKATSESYRNQLDNLAKTAQMRQDRIYTLESGQNAEITRLRELCIAREQELDKVRSENDLTKRIANAVVGAVAGGIR